MNDLDHTQVDCAAFDLRSGPLGLSLRFNGEALATIRREIGAGFLSIPRRGAEAGGVLKGDMVQNENEWIVTIESVSPVPIEYQYGPSYKLSATDTRNFRETANEQEGGSRSIGWFRSNTRSEHEMEEDDRRISHTFFGAQSIFLFCEPFADGQIRASCAIVLPENTEVSFPFEAGHFSRLDTILNPQRAMPRKVAAEAGDFDAIIPLPEGTAPAETPLPGITAPPRPNQLASSNFTADNGAPGRRLFRSIVSGTNLKIAAAIIAAASIAYYARGRTLSLATASAAATPGNARHAEASLGLRAEYQGDSLLLGWDRRSPQITSAISGVFTIADGSRTRVLNLSPRELRNGSIVYRPSADEIRVELDVTARQGVTVSQSIRIIGALAPVSTSTPQQPPVAQQLTAHTAAIRRQEETSAAQFHAPPASAVPAPRTIAMLEAPVINEDGAMRGDAAESAVVQLPPQPSSASAPRVDSGAGAASLAVSSAVSAPAIVIASLSSLSRTPVAPASMPRPTLTKTAPATDAPAARVFEAARPVHSPQPLLPQGAALPEYALDHAFEVKVEVTIDTAGRVTGARLVGEAGPYASQLGPSALNAARAWTFRPATLGGQEVASTMVVTFRYSRPR